MHSLSKTLLVFALLKSALGRTLLAFAKFIETENRRMAAREWCGGIEGVILFGYKISVLQ